MGAATSAAARARIEGEAKRHRAVWQKHLAPAQRGVPFRVPQLCFSFEGALELAEREAFLDAFPQRRRALRLVDAPPR
jgi:hypothetical protein